MGSADRYINGLVNNLENLTGTLSSPEYIMGYLSNATLRGVPVELRMNNTMLQWKYANEDDIKWRNLINLSFVDYNELQNHPLINGIELVGNKSFADLGIEQRYSKKNETVATITRNGTTFTVTRADGTTFTFDQQDTTYQDATAQNSGLMSAVDKSKLNGIEAGSQVNVIDVIKVNGTNQTVSNKSVNINVPTDNSQLANGAGYQTASQVETKVESYGYQTENNVVAKIESYGYQDASDVESAIQTALSGFTGVSYHICQAGEYNTTTLVPTLAGEAGVIYLVPKNVSETNNIYYEYIYNNSSYEKIGDTEIDLSDYLNTSDIASLQDVLDVLDEVYERSL